LTPSKLKACITIFFNEENPLKADILEYIEVFYNRMRRHAKIGNQIPADFGNPYYSSKQIAA